MNMPLFHLLQNALKLVHLKVRILCHQNLKTIKCCAEPAKVCSADRIV